MVADVQSERKIIDLACSPAPVFIWKKDCWSIIMWEMVRVFSFEIM